MTSKMPHLAGKVAIITGAGGSIGRAHALRFAEEGAHVVVNDLGEDRAEAVVAEAKEAGGEATVSTDSVATMEGCRRMVQTALDNYGRIDILVNNAAVFRHNLVFDFTEEDFDAIVSVHLKGTFMMTKHVAPHLRDQRSGVIINTGSISGQGHYGSSIYAAAKEGVTGFTRSIARDLGPYNVRCNSIRPRAASANIRTAVQSEATSKAMQLWRDAEEVYGFPSCGDLWAVNFLRTAASGGYDPGHIADFAVWLSTDAAANVNGADFQVCGGEIGLMSEPLPTRVIFRNDRWTIDNLNEPLARHALVGDMQNRFLGQPSVEVSDGLDDSYATKTK